MINVYFNPQLFQNLYFYFYLFYSSVPTDREINEERESTAMAGTLFCFDVWKRRKEERGMYFNFDEGRRKANSK